jgi:hypothetical protein
MASKKSSFFLSEEITLLKSNHEQDLESIKAIHQTELEKVQAAIDETEIKRLRGEAEVKSLFKTC